METECNIIWKLIQSVAGFLTEDAYVTIRRCFHSLTFAGSPHLLCFKTFQIFHSTLEL